jgi:hypothetical protein
MKNILVVGDLHEPFCLDGYLEWNKHIYKKYNCSHTIFLGDTIDNHFASFHETDPDGMSGKEELDQAIKRLQKWHKSFPNADVCIGNHDAIPFRKGYSSGLPKVWIKEYKDVLNTPTWNFAERFVYNDIQFVHGTAQKARMRAKNDLMSTVQGHYHTEHYLDYYVGANFKIFAMQIGCGLDRMAYAAAYGKHFKKPAIGSGVILKDLPIPLLMKL